MVSILMVTYNHETSVRQAVASVLAQSPADFELVICDDASTDGTVAFLRGLGDSRIRVLFHDRNRGIAESYRDGIAVCRGKYLAFLEGDDAWERTNLQEKTAVLDREPGVGLVYSNVTLEADEAVRASKRFYLRAVMSVPHSRPFDPSAYLAARNLIPTFSSVVMRRELADGFVYPPERFQTWLDWFLWNHAGSRTLFFFCPERLVVWRHHPAGAYGRESAKGYWRLKACEAGLRLRFLCRAWGARISLGKKIGITFSFVRGACAAAASRIFDR